MCVERLMSLVLSLVSMFSIAFGGLVYFGTFLCSDGLQVDYVNRKVFSLPTLWY